MIEASLPEIQVPYSRVVQFVRQLSHDLRNQLNAAELQAAFINEIAEGAELKTEIKKLRTTISEFGTALQKITVALGSPKLTKMDYAARDLVEDLQRKIAAELPNDAVQIDWEVKLPMNVILKIDPQFLEDALLELLRNAFTHDRGKGKISVVAHADAKQFCFVLREPKASFDRSTYRWGREPFVNVGRGHYGLGLARARNILEAHQAQLSANYDSSAATFVTTVALPIDPIL